MKFHVPWRQFGPVLVAVFLLVGLPHVLSHDTRDASAIEARSDRLQETVDMSPTRIGNWIGDDVPIPTAAVELLRPSAILSRGYRNTTDGRWITLVIVHCSDARDMGAHYPPVCYPAQGWTQHASPQLCTVSIGSERLPLHVYDFVRTTGGQATGLRVLNCFIGPDGTFSADRPSINYLVERYRLSARGIAQVQLVMPGGWSLTDAASAAQELLEGHAELITLLAHEGTVQ